MFNLENTRVHSEPSTAIIIVANKHRIYLVESLLLSERWEALLKVLCWVAALNSLIVSSACRWCAESVWKKEEMEKLSAAVKKGQKRQQETKQQGGIAKTIQARLSSHVNSIITYQRRSARPSV